MTSRKIKCEYPDRAIGIIFMAGMFIVVTILLILEKYLGLVTLFVRLTTGG